MFTVAFGRNRGRNGMFTEFKFVHAEEVTCTKVYKTEVKTNKLQNIDGTLKLVECDPYEDTQLDHYRIECFQKYSDEEFGKKQAPTYLVNYNSKQDGNWEHFYIQDMRTNGIFRPSGF